MHKIELRTAVRITRIISCSALHPYNPRHPRLPSLGHDGQCEIVAGPAFVVGLESIDTDSNGCAIGEIAEGARDWCCRGIVNHRKDCAWWNNTAAAIVKEDLSAANADAPGLNLVRRRHAALHRDFVGGVRQKLQLLLDR